MRNGGRDLWETGREELRRHWADALDHKTELWPREGGQTLQRWRERLPALSSEEGNSSEETKTVVTEAANVDEGHSVETLKLG